MRPWRHRANNQPLSNAANIFCRTALAPHRRPRGLRLAAVLALLILLAAVLPAYAKSPTPIGAPSGAPAASLETCDTPALPDWTVSPALDQPVSIVDGACALDPSVTASYRYPLLDFQMKFIAQLPENGRLKVRLDWYMDHWVEVVLGSTDATIKEYSESGSAAPDITEQLLAEGQSHLKPGVFYAVVITHRQRNLLIEIDNQPVASAAVDSLHASPQLAVTGGVLVDNLQVAPLALGQEGERLPGFPDALLESSIAFRGSDGRLWWVGADGTKLKKTQPDILPGEMIFSPDGALLALDDNGWMRIVDAASKSVLSAWQAEEIQRAPFDWSAGGRLLVIDGQVPLQINELDPVSAKTIKTYTLPKAVEAGGFAAQRVTRLNSSPVSRVVQLDLLGELDGTSVTRCALYELDSGQISLFPGCAGSTWWPDGTRLLFSGGVIEYPTLALREEPQQERPPSNFSPDGRYAVRRTGRASQMTILAAADARPLAILPGQPSWAPDSQHVVYADNGRITVQNVLNPAYLQIAEGTGPAWQPRPAFSNTAAPVETSTPSATPTLAATATPVRTATATAAITDTPAATSVPPATDTPEDTDAIVSTASASTTAASTDAVESTDAAASAAASVPTAGGVPSAPGPEAGQPSAARAFWPAALLAAGLTLSGMALAALRPSKQNCPNCARSSTLDVATCWFCGAALPPRKPPRWKPSRPRSIALAAAGMMLAGAGLGMVLAFRAEPGNTAVKPAAQTGAALETTPQTAVPQATPLTLPTRMGDGCAAFNVEAASLPEVYARLKNSAARGFARPTPATALTLSPDAAGSQDGEYEWLPGCQMVELSTSPDGKQVLAAYADASAGSHWAVLVLYRSATLQPLWAKPVDFVPQKVLWSPDSARVALRGSRRWVILSTGAAAAFAAGEQINVIPDSTRARGWCSDPKNDENLLWLPDSRRLMRKIYNAVQVIHSETGELLSETRVDDTQMASANLEEGGVLCSHSLYWAPDGSAFITLPGPSADGQEKIGLSSHVRKWDTASGSLLWDQAIAQSPGDTQTWSPDGQWFLYRLSEPFTMLDAPTGKPGGSAPPPESMGDGSRALWSRDSSTLAVEAEAGKGILLFTPSTGAVETSPSPDGQRVQPADWLADGRLLVKTIPQEDQVERYWVFDPQTGRWTELGDFERLEK